MKLVFDWTTTCFALLLVAQTMIVHGNEPLGLDLLNLNLGLNLVDSIVGTQGTQGAQGAHGAQGGHNSVNQFKAIYEKAAPYLAAKNIGKSLTLLTFDDITSGNQATILNHLTKDAAGCVTLIQEHTFGPAQNISQLIQKGTVINLNGRPITFVSSEYDKTIRINGKLVLQTDIALGTNIVGHKLEGPLTFEPPKSNTVDVVPNLIGGLLGHVGVLLQFVLTLLHGLLGPLLGGLGLTKETPLTYFPPSPKELDGLKNSYQRLGPLFAKPAFEKVLKENIFHGSISPLELLHTNELTNIAGQKKTVEKLEDGQVKIGESIVNPNEVVATSNGFAYAASKYTGATAKDILITGADFANAAVTATSKISNVDPLKVPGYPLSNQQSVPTSG